MTVSSTIRRAGPYPGNGVATSFPFDFKVYAKADIAVVFANSLGVESTLVLDSDYSVTLNADQDTTPGGSITYPISGSPMSSTQALAIVGALDYAQTTALPNGGAYNATIVERALDRITILTQQLRETVNRGVQLAFTTAADVSSRLPAPRAFSVLGWASDGLSLTNFDAAGLGVSVSYAAWQTQTFNGTGAQTAFVLTSDAGVASNCDVAVGGVTQTPGINFSYDPTAKTITFLTGAPPVGTNNVVVRYGQALPQGTVASASITDSTATGRSVLTAANAAAARTAIGAQAAGDGTGIASLPSLTTPVSLIALRSYLSGLTLSTAGSSATMSIAAGVAMDSTNTYLMQLSSAISKTTSAWAVGSGNGGLDTGTIKSSALGATCSYATSVMTCTVAPTSGTFQVGQSIVADGIPANTVISSLGTGTGGTGTYNLSTSPGTLAARNTRGLFWYYPYLIRRPDTGIVDGLFSLSVSSPTLPTNYTQFRRLGGMHTDGSALWPSFIQDGDHFQLVASNLDVGGLNPGTSAVSATLSVPMGINVDADIIVLLSDSTNLGSGAYISDLATPDLAPSATAAPLLSTPQIATTNIAVAANLRVRTNTSAQIRYRCNTSFASLAFRIATLGWYDSRGKNL